MLPKSTLPLVKVASVARVVAAGVESPLPEEVAYSLCRAAFRGSAGGDGSRMKKSGKGGRSFGFTRRA